MSKLVSSFNSPTTAIGRSVLITLNISTNVDVWQYDNYGEVPHTMVAFHKICCFLAALIGAWALQNLFITALSESTTQSKIKTI